MKNKETVLQFHKKNYEEGNDTIYGFFGDYRFLSNYHLVDIEYEGIVYPSTENIYQLAKERYNKNTFKTIFSKITPNESKFLGKYLPIRDDWNEIKYSIMYKINYKKFNENALLKQALLATGNKTLIELNWWGDTYWGSILDENCNLIGENNLGKVLMEVRGCL